MIYVIDASVALRWCIKDFSHKNADLVLEKVLYDPGSFSVPELFLYEVYAVLQRHHPFALTVFSEDIEAVVRSGLLRYPMTENIYTRAESFINMGLTGYDAVYAALAGELEGKWLTFDRKAHETISEEGLSICLLDQGGMDEGHSYS